MIGTYNRNSIIILVREDGFCFANYLDSRFTIHGRKITGKATVDQLFARAEAMLRAAGTTTKKGEKLSLATLNASVGKYNTNKTI